uniref:Uncharacterized protein n=1 Tax=Rhizophora mucronata TaxID=61149 RepID=A0A2P2N781_RHIMU
MRFSIKPRLHSGFPFVLVPTTNIISV